MKIILVWAAEAPEMKILMDGLAGAGHAISYWVGERGAERFAPEGCVFHDHYDAWSGARAVAFADAAIEPPSAEVIRRMYRIESITLSMMNKRYDAASVDERRHIYYAMVAYWNFVLDKMRPDAIVFAIVPHTVYNYVLFELAAMRGIPTICFEETWVGGRLLLHRDFWKGSDDLRAAVARLSAQGVSSADLGEDMRRYWDAQRNPGVAKTPWYMIEQKQLSHGIGLWIHRARIAVSSPVRVLPRLASLVSRSFAANLKTEYGRVARVPDAGVPYVYFPLNFQPERTTSPQGDMYHDQILAVETLAAALPEGWEIHVKEHPSQWWLRTKTRYSSSRYPGYYERIARIPGVRVVPIETDTFSLLEHARAIATITGTAGWEALLRGKRPLVFGIPWYRDCPGVLLVRSLEDCRNAIASILSATAVREEDVLAFLKALEETGTRAHIGGSEAVVPVIGKEESMRAIVATLNRELRSMIRD